MKIKDISLENRPREKARIYGIETLALNELVSIILGSGFHDHNVMEISQNILSSFGTLKDLSLARIDELRKVKGIGTVNALKILAIFELFKRFEKENNYLPIKKISSNDIFLRYKNYFCFKTQEELIVVTVSRMNTLKTSHILYKGSSDQIVVSIREIITTVLRNGDDKFYLIHNHPNGDINPSNEDFELTVKLISECNRLKIKLIDHLIVNNDEYYSFRHNKNCNSI